MIDVLIVTLLAAAIGFRAGRAIAMDDVGEPLRQKTVDIKSANPRARWRDWLVGLFKCPHCIGFHLTIVTALVVSAILLDVDWPVDIIIALAATGAQSLMTTYAQAHKLEVVVEDEQPDE